MPSMNLPSISPDRPRPQSGQALLEFSLALIVILPFIFGGFSVWNQFQKNHSYSQGAQALSSWISHAGAYTNDQCLVVSTMGCSIKQQLDNIPGVSSEEAYLYISTRLPDGSLGPAVGLDPTTLPESESTRPEIDSPGRGWSSDINCLPAGSLISVHIYGYHELSVPMTPLHSWNRVIGTAIVEVLQEAEGGVACT